MEFQITSSLKSLLSKGAEISRTTVAPKDTGCSIRHTKFHIIIMPRPRALSEHAVSLILLLATILRSTGMHGVVSFILRTLEFAVSRRTIERVLNSASRQARPSIGQQGGRPRILSARNARFLTRQLGSRNRDREATPLDYLRSAMSGVGVHVSRETVRAALLRDRNVRLSAPLPTQFNNRRTRAARLNWAYANQQRNWIGAYFYDEKLFRFDGPVRPRRAWRDMRVSQPNHIRRVAGGGSTMMLLLLGPEGFLSVAVQRGSVDQNDVFDFLSSALPRPSSLMFDNSKTHNRSKRELPNLGIELIGQAPYSADTQPTENVFSVISRLVHGDNIQFFSHDALEARINSVINNMILRRDDIALYERLAASMSRRVAGVIEAGGGPLRPSY